LLFSSLFELMSLVVTKVFPSVNAAYQSEKENIGPIEIGVANFSEELFKIDEKSNRNWMSAVASNARVVMAGGA
jgi:hypothetical protein